MSSATTLATAEPASTAGGPRRRQGQGSTTDRPQAVAGRLFVAPAVVLLITFVAVPILMALYVSLTNWSGQGSPFGGNTRFVGLDNYRRLLGNDGLVRKDFMTSIRNTGYYVIGVVPAQTIAALFLAIILNQKLRARSFFRTAFYFPSVTSSVAVTLVFLFLFTGSGPINAILSWVGIDGPSWFGDADGVIHLIGNGLGVWDSDNPPDALTSGGPLSLSWWEWISGPSVAMTAIMMLVVWTTTGTFMLMFLAALQDVPQEVHEAALVDGAGRWRTFRSVILPMLKPTVFLVLTLGLIGTWQVFDQILLTGQGGPAKTTLTPAYLSYDYSFNQGRWGLGTAMAFVLFAIIITLTLLQRYVMRDKDASRERKAERAAKKERARRSSSTVFASGGDR